MSLVETTKSLLGRELREEEVQALSRFQQTFEIDDEDPLIVVLAMMSVNRLIVDEQAKTLEDRAKHTIELHQQTLREQSTLIAKELIVAVGNMVASTNIGIKHRRAVLFATFMGGLILGGLVVRLFWH